jgi:phage shock protein PspC (stress-responsive transcriptional regulator)
MAMSLSDELSKLSELRASGALSEEEFASAKARLLNATGPGATAPGASAPGAYAARTDEPIIAGVNAFRRSRSDRVLGGVCGGMARATGVESWVWRLIFAVLFIFAGMGLLAYVLLWIFVPSE